MKNKRKAPGGGGSSSTGGIVVEASNRKVRRKEQRHAKKSKKQQHQHPSAADTKLQHVAKSRSGSNNRHKKVENDKKRVKFSDTVQEKTFDIKSKPSIQTSLLRKSRKQSHQVHDDKDDDSDDGFNINPDTNRSINYDNLDEETAIALRRDDMEIDYLESNLGIKGNSRNTKRNKELNREYAKNEGFGDDFGDFLMGLDGLVERVVDGRDLSGGEEDNGSDGSDAEEENSDASGSDNDDTGRKHKQFESQIDDNSHSDSDSDEYNYNEEDPYANLDEETALAFRNDDAEIAQLEEKLGLSSSKKAKKKLNKEFAKTFGGYGEDFGDFLENLDGLGDRIRGADGDNSDEVSDDGSENEMESGGDDDDSSSDGSNEKQPHLDDDDSESEDSDGSQSEDDKSDDDHDVALTYRPTSGEDIYGNKVDSSGDGIKPTKYVPPHLRKKMQESGDATAHNTDGNNNATQGAAPTAAIAADPQTIRLIQRSLNNSLNRLSDQTLESVSKSIAALYSQYPFHDMNDCLWTNIQLACVPPHMIMSGLIPLYIAAMSGVHWLGGDKIQLGGCLVEWSVRQLCNSLEKGRSSSGDEAKVQELVNKEASNTLLIVSYLYNYGVVHCTLIYDLVRNFIESFSELDIEALLLILSHCGQQLRADDPSALKEIVLLVKERAQKVANGEQSVDSSRVQYMVSTITELKNNKPRKQDVVIRDKTNGFKKCIGRLKSSHISSSSSLTGSKSNSSCLRITLRDVLDAETKGRWWMVGASWAGNQHRHQLWDEDYNAANKDAEGDGVGRFSKMSGSRSSPATKESEEDKLLALASSQRMNTDSRRAIFCIVMGSSDCEDAFEKLVRAGMLKPKAERDVIRVLVQCCGEEKAFNPFYAFLAMRVCEYQPKSKTRVQC
eukprot:scaffold69_cov198-Alexandrium_tamarense.AAC.70